MESPSPSLNSDSTAPAGPSRDYFVTTRWTVILDAGRNSSPQSERALGDLCQTYWYPLYAYVRRRGYAREDAEDLVQSFFARLLGTHSLEGLSAERGKFRAFLLASLNVPSSESRFRALTCPFDPKLVPKGGAMHAIRACWWCIVRPASLPMPFCVAQRTI